MVQRRQQQCQRLWWLPRLVILAWSCISWEQRQQRAWQGAMAGQTRSSPKPAQEGDLSTLRCTTQGRETEHRGGRFVKQCWRIRQRAAESCECCQKGRAAGQAAGWRKARPCSAMERLRGRAQEMLFQRKAALSQCSSETGARRDRGYGRADRRKRKPQEGCCRADSRAGGLPHGDPGPGVRDAHQGRERGTTAGGGCGCSHTESHGRSTSPRSHEGSSDCSCEYSIATDTLPAYDPRQSIQCAAQCADWECWRPSRPDGAKHQSEHHGQHRSLPVLSCHFDGIYSQGNNQRQRWDRQGRAQGCHEAQTAGASLLDEELAISGGEVGGEERQANGSSTFQRACPSLGAQGRADSCLGRARAERERTPWHPNFSACAAVRRWRRRLGEPGDTTRRSGRDCTRCSPARLTEGQSPFDSGARQPWLRYSVATDSEASSAQVGVFLCGDRTVCLSFMAALQRMLLGNWPRNIWEDAERYAMNFCLSWVSQFCGGDGLWICLAIAGQRGGWDPMWIPGHVPAESLPFIPCTDFPPVTGWPPLVPDRGSCADGTVEVACKDFILDYILDRKALKACFEENSAHDLSLRLVLYPCAQQLGGNSCLPPATGWLRSPGTGPCADGAVEMRHVCHLQWQLVMQRLRCMKPLHLWWALVSAAGPRALDCPIFVPPATGWLCPCFPAESCADGAVEMVEAQFQVAASTCSSSSSLSYGDGHCESPLGQSPFFLSIWDGAPFTLAGGRKPHLHQQSMLPRLCALTISYSSCPSLYVTNPTSPDTDLFDQDPPDGARPLTGQHPLCFASIAVMPSSLQCCDCCLPHAQAHCSHHGQRGGLRHVSEGHVPSESSIQHIRVVPEGGSIDNPAWPSYERRGGVTYVAIHNLHSWLEKCIFHCLYSIGLLCLWAAAEFQCFFSTLALMGLVYCFKLWAYAFLLKGGTHNYDPLVRTSRALCRGCPLHLGAGLREFSPRLSRAHVSNRAPRRNRIGFSRDFICLLLLIWLCISQAEAAQGQRFSSQPTWYPAPDTTHGYTYGPRGLEQQRQRLETLTPHLMRIPLRRRILRNPTPKAVHRTPPRCLLLMKQSDRRAVSKWSASATDLSSSASLVGMGYIWRGALSSRMSTYKLGPQVAMEL